MNYENDVPVYDNFKDVPETGHCRLFNTSNMKDSEISSEAQHIANLTGATAIVDLVNLTTNTRSVNFMYHKK